MGKKSGPAAPPAPDPVATAAAQEKQNIGSAVAQANLNRIDQYTPQGSLTYKQTGTNADGTPQYQQTQAYSPDEQKKYDLTNQVAMSLDGLANDNISRVSDAQKTPFSYDGMQPLVTQFGGRNPFQLQNGPAGGGAVGVDANAGGPIQKSLDYSHLTSLPGTSDFGAEQQRTANSVFQQAASRLDPKWSQSDSDLKSSLAAQGISENSDAYRRAVDNQSRAKNDAYNQATYSAQQAGSNEQSRIFGLAMGARQQGQNEVDTKGNFVNSAVGQGFGQAATAAEQGMAANQQNFQQEQAAAAMNNQNQSTFFGQAQQRADFSNQARQQQIQEAAYKRNMPINDIAALLGTGGGVSDPSFSNFAQVGVAAPDYMGAVNNNYNAANQQYVAKQQARSQMLGSIFGAAGTAGAAAMKFSDRRLKENIKRIGTLANGLATYTYNYIGDKAKQFGVMAQEALGIVPEAVGYTPSGVMYVDYGKVY